MKKIVLLTILLLGLMISNVNAVELVLPAERVNVTTSNYAFFVGRAKSSESLSINGHNVYTAPNGAFAYSVKLHEGENRIMIKTAYGLQLYKFIKNTVSEQPIKAEEFNKVKAIVNTDNTPLRNTPIDNGLNRISHLFSGTELVLNGSKGDFYRVFLSKNKEAWIAKKDVTITDSDFYAAEFIGMNTERFKNAMIQTISFNKNLPYTIEDIEKEIIFRVYNPELSEESVYTLNIPKPEKYTYFVTLDNGMYTFKVKKLPETKDDITVVIDAGHGGSEKGAVGCLGTEEKNVNLKIAQKTAELLAKKGINVVMTREVDANISLEDRVKFAKENNADIFVSIHLNSIPDIPMNIHKNRGTSVYYFNNNSKDFAGFMEKIVTKIAGTYDGGVFGASFAVIRPTEYIGILVEAAYMTNPMDTMLYTDEKWLNKASKAISDGIIKYIEK